MWGAFFSLQFCFGAPTLGFLFRSPLQHPITPDNLIAHTWSCCFTETKRILAGFSLCYFYFVFNIWTLNFIITGKLLLFTVVDSAFPLGTVFFETFVACSVFAVWLLFHLIYTPTLLPVFKHAKKKIPKQNKQNQKLLQWLEKYMAHTRHLKSTELNVVLFECSLYWQWLNCCLLL